MIWPSLSPRYLKPSGSCPLRGSLTHFRDYLSESMIIDKPWCEKKRLWVIIIRDFVWKHWETLAQPIMCLLKSPHRFRHFCSKIVVYSTYPHHNTTPSHTCVTRAHARTHTQMAKCKLCNWVKPNVFFSFSTFSIPLRALSPHYFLLLGERGAHSPLALQICRSAEIWAKANTEQGAV